jgi:precorrin-6A/cobalt-precorrin-6A reductase
MTVLILGGTGEAAEVAELAVAEKCWHVLTSLAGRTKAPRALAGDVRVGGFGGVDGLAQYMRDNAVTNVVDATHPFAVTISRHAEEACERLSIPRVMLRRMPWQREPKDDWIEVGSHAEASQRIPQGAGRIFLTTGKQNLAVYSTHDDKWFLVRVVDKPEHVPLANYALVVARGPFSETQETELLEHHGIETLVAKNSGGAGTYAKILAARRHRIPVVMLQPPTPTPGEGVDTPAEVIAWLRDNER